MMKKLLLFVFTLGFLASAVTAQAGNKEVVGSWKYSVDQAPYGYEKGTIIISEKEGQLVGKIKFEDGYELELKSIKYADGVLKVGLYVDYEYVTVKAKVKGNKLTGVVDTPEGEMDIVAERKTM